MQTAKTTVQFNLTPIDNARECIISPSSQMPLSALFKAQILNWLKCHGVVVLRHFEPSEDIGILIDKTSRHISGDPGRVFSQSAFQPVNSGNNAIGLHTENGSCPATPDLLWLNCLKAPSHGSQTTFCDGEQVYQAMPTAMKKQLMAKALKFERIVPYATWQRYAKLELGLSQSSAPVSLAQLNQIQGKWRSHQSTLNHDNSITMTVIAPAIHPSNFSAHLCFANSLFGPSDCHQKPKICFADDSPISQRLLIALNQLCRQHTTKIQWQPGDLCLIDNSRYMHGREAITCDRRQIIVAMSYL